MSDEQPSAPLGSAPIAVAPWRPQRRVLTRLLPTMGRLMLVVLAAGLVYRIVRFALGFPLWGDEAFLAMNFVLRDYAGMLRPPLEYNQQAPLLFLWGQLAVVRAMGISDYTLRLLPFVCGLASLLLFWPFAVRMLNRRAALMAVAILAAAFYPVRHAVEVKPYALDLLAGLALTWLAWRVAQGPRSAGRWAALIAVAASAAWYSFPSAFVSAGAGLFLAWKVLRRPSVRPVAALAVFALAVGVSFWAMVRVYAGPHAAASPQYQTMSMWVNAFPPLRESFVGGPHAGPRPWLLLGWLLDVHTGNMLAYPVGGNHFGSTATFLLVVAGCVSLWRKSSRGRDLIFLLLAPLLFTFVAAAMKRYPYGTSARISLYMAPAFCLLAGEGLVTAIRWFAPRRWTAEVFRVAVLVMVTIALAGTAVSIAQPYKRADYNDNRHAIRTLAALTGPGDEWVVANSLGEAQHLPLLGGKCSHSFRYYVHVLSPVKILWGPTLDQVPAVPGKVVLIYLRESDEPDQPLRARQFADYLQALTARLGPPKRREFTLRQEEKVALSPVIEAYVFPSSSGGKAEGATTRPGTAGPGTAIPRTGG